MVIPAEKMARINPKDRITMAADLRLRVRIAACETQNNRIVILFMLRHINLWDVLVESLLLRRRFIHKDESANVTGVARGKVVSHGLLIFLRLHEGGMLGLVATMPRQPELRESVSFSHIAQGEASATRAQLRYSL